MYSVVFCSRPPYLSKTYYPTSISFKQPKRHSIPCASARLREEIIAETMVRLNYLLCNYWSAVEVLDQLRPSRAAKQQATDKETFQYTYKMN